MTKDAMILALAERVYAAHEVLAHLAERRTGLCDK